MLPEDHPKALETLLRSIHLQRLRPDLRPSTAEVVDLAVVADMIALTPWPRLVQSCWTLSQTPLIHRVTSSYSQLRIFSTIVAYWDGSPDSYSSTAAVRSQALTTLLIPLTLSPGKFSVCDFRSDVDAKRP
jgi:hypothetical protein